MQLAQSILHEELQIFEKKFRDAVKSQAMVLDRIMRFIVKRKGKQLRPMFVFLSARLCGEINESTYRAASLVELLHTATLVHDDVVDESLERRGFLFDLCALEKQDLCPGGGLSAGQGACCFRSTTTISGSCNCSQEQYAR